MWTKLISLAVLAAPVLGCGGGDDPSAWFAGNWDYVRGEVHCAVPGSMAYLGDVTGQLVVTRVDDVYIQATMSPDCALRFAVDVNYVASAVGGQTCPLDVPGLGARSPSSLAWQLSVDDPAVVPGNGRQLGSPAPVPLMLSHMTAAVDGCSTLTLSGNLTLTRRM